MKILHGTRRVRNPDIDLGLALLHERRLPGVRYTIDEIALWCGCTRTTIWNIEQRALKTLRHRLPQSLKP